MSSLHSANRLGPGVARPAAIAVIVIVFQIYMILTHVAWRDESQAFLIATQPKLADLLSSLHYEGHPALWYLLVRAAATIAPSLSALKLLQLPIALTTAGLIWFRAPFGPWFRLGLLTNYFILFEYGVIARSYGLGTLLFFAFMVLRKSDWRWVILALMTNIAVHYMLLSAVLIVMQVVIEERPDWRALDARFFVGLGLWVMGCLIATATFWPAPDVQAAIPHPPDLWVNVMMALHWASIAISPGLTQWGANFYPPISLALALDAGLLGAAALAARPRMVALWLAFYFLILALSTGLYFAYGRHVGLWVLLLIGLLWIGAERDDLKPGLAAYAWIGLLSASGLIWTVSAIMTPFSSGDMATAWLKAQHLDQRTICAYPGWHGLDLSPRLGAPYFNLQTGRPTRFETWNYQAGLLKDSDVLAVLTRNASRTLGAELIIYSTANNPLLTELHAKTLVAFPKDLLGQSMAIYSLTP